MSQCNKRGETPLDKCKPYLAEILRGEEIKKNFDHGFCSPFLLIIIEVFRNSYIVQNIKLF